MTHTPIPTTPPPLDTIVYSRSGHRAKYICSVVGPYCSEHFVKPEIEFGLPDGDVDSSFEGAAVWHEFFLSPPREVIDKEIAALEEKAAALRAEVIQLDQEKSAAEREVVARKARLAQHAQLKQLDDFITKGVTCYVMDRKYGELEIVDFKNTKSDYGDRSFRLLSLFGDSKGQLNWGLNRYSDGSGDTIECIPCANREDATAAVAELLNRRWAEWRENGRGYIAAYAKVANQHGVSVPEDVLAQIAKDETEAKQKNLERAEKAFVDAQAALMKAQEGIVDRSGAPAKPVPCAPTPKSP